MQPDDTTQTDAKKKQDTTNPCSAAFKHGVVGSACVALGASVRNNNVHDEALTVLVGGVITGAMAGLVHCCLPNSRSDNRFYLNVCVGLTKLVLSLAAFLTAPLMGELCLSLKTDWGKTIVDELVGSGAIIASILAATAVAMMIGIVCVGAENVFGRVRNLRAGFFGGGNIGEGDSYSTIQTYRA